MACRLLGAKPLSELAGANGVAVGSSLARPRHRWTLGPHGLYLNQCWNIVNSMLGTHFGESLSKMMLRLSTHICAARPQ